MQALEKRRKYLENWEFENQKLLEEIFRQLFRFGKRFVVLGFYLNYKLVKLAGVLFQVLFFDEREVNHFLELEKSKRYELSSHGSFWTK